LLYFSYTSQHVEHVLLPVSVKLSQRFAVTLEGSDLAKLPSVNTIVNTQ
jgi:hypothetical protein